jgi:hypothetical protein
VRTREERMAASREETPARETTSPAKAATATGAALGIGRAAA